MTQRLNTGRGLKGIRLVALAAMTVVAVAAPASAETSMFTDGSNDAYRAPGSEESPPSFQPEAPFLSDPTADITAAGFETVSVAKGSPKSRHYRATMTILGTPDPSYSYVVAGAFGDNCQLYHFLTPGITSFANAFCGPEGARRFLGQIKGTSVEVNGSTLSATYTYTPRQLPAELAADTTLGPLFAFTCVSGDEGLGCRTYEALDVARDPLKTFTI